MAFLLRALCAAVALSPCASAIAAPLIASEQRIGAIVDAEQERTVAMLEKWVNQNSGTMNFAGVKAVGDMLRVELEPLGFKVDWIDISTANRAGHIVARHKGNGRGKRLLLIGHLDTVFEPDSPFQRWSREGNLGLGPGAGDDKGGMAVIVAAVRAMKAAGTLKNADMTVFMSGDEEDAGPLEIARRDLIAAGKWADVALDFEALAQVDGRDMGSIARRSSDEWTLVVAARSGHSSGIFSPSAGSGAIYELARIIDTFRRDLTEDKLTFNVGLIGGGTSAELTGDNLRIAATGKTNVIAGTAIARGDMRGISPEQIARAQAKMRAIVAQPLIGATAEIKFAPDGYPPMAPTEGSRALLNRLNQVNRDMNLPEMGELDPVRRGAADISFVAKDVDGLVGLGPAGSGSHSPREKVDIGSIYLQAKRAAILMSRLAKERRPR
ncbi:MAG: M20/M25/M40 family metallo-hydrolase [Sphingomonas sp.]|uniref:M20/M25/M40 family metallo-hydrolase n=1 Tax=Sphingomonas sp. TaxID=28214 RepID=UPI0017B86A7C|nr:M20/M25/M40 family metallo-hydrolase [Sphingomonas sp.]MBA3666395.1 M20/M25/M40 family metallo-hydrolase [Sphingomonas sp.]